jgi:hypothetical protein
MSCAVRLFPFPACNNVALETTPHRGPISTLAVDAGGDLVFTADGTGMILIQVLVRRAESITSDEQVRSCYVSPTMAMCNVGHSCPYIIVRCHACRLTVTKKGMCKSHMSRSTTERWMCSVYRTLSARIGHLHVCTCQKISLMV